MNNFIRKVSVFFTIIVLIFLLLYNLYSFRYVEKFIDIDDTYDIINLGNSHGSAFKYESLNLKGKSFNKPSNTLYYDFQNYKYLKPYLNKGAIVIIPVSFFSFGLDENRTDRDDSNLFVEDFYGYLPHHSIYDFTYRKKIGAYMNRIKNNFFYSFKSLAKNGASEPISVLMSKEEIDNHAIQRASHHMLIGTYRDPDINIKILSSLIEDALKSGYRPVLVTVPYYLCYTELFEKSWLEKHYFTYIRDLEIKYQIPYLNYKDHYELTTNHILYQNSDHLNSKGGIFFSNVFFDDLRQMGYLIDE